jgi:hypothetical protein
VGDVEQAPGALLVVDVVVDPEHEDDFNRWYDEEHIPEKRATPGFRSARRFAHMDGGGRYLAVYEVDDVDTVTSEAYMTQPQSEWSKSVQAHWLRLDRSVWVEITRP